MSKKMKETKAWKKITILAVTVVTVACLVCLGWYIFCELPYVAYTDVLQHYPNSNSQLVDDMGSPYTKGEIDGFKCEVHGPDFLSSKGFVAVKSGKFSVTVMDDGTMVTPDEPNITLFIWPSVFGKTTYGLMLDYEKENIMRQARIEISNDKEGNYVITHQLQDDENALALYEEYEETIIDMVECAENAWHFMDEEVNPIVNGWDVKRASKYN